MKFTRKSYGRLLRSDGTQLSQHTVAEEAYERASREGPGKYAWQVKPYAIWKLELPFARDEGLLGGAAYDPSTNRIYSSQYHADGDNPVIHVFEV